MCTHEHDGWYLPAGRVDFGETFTTGAVREAQEEAGIPVRLDGILRLEHTPGLRNNRFRAIFAASPVDDTPPRSEADDEIIEAKWLTLDEVRRLPIKRSEEMVYILEWAAAGAKVFPLSLLHGIDSEHISHVAFQTRLVYSVLVVIPQPNEDAATNPSVMVTRRENGSFGLPRFVLPNPKPLKVAAAEVLFKKLGFYLEIKRLILLDHCPPLSADSVGYIQAVYLGHVAAKDHSKITPSSSFIEQGFEFASVEDLLSQRNQSEPYFEGQTDERTLLTSVKEACPINESSFFPVEVIELEQARYKLL